MAPKATVPLKRIALAMRFFSGSQVSSLDFSAKRLRELRAFRLASFLSIRELQTSVMKVTVSRVKRMKLLASELVAFRFSFSIKNVVPMILTKSRTAEKLDKMRSDLTVSSYICLVTAFRI